MTVAGWNANMLRNYCPGEPLQIKRAGKAIFPPLRCPSMSLGYAPGAPQFTAAAFFSTVVTAPAPFFILAARR